MFLRRISLTFIVAAIAGMAQTTTTTTTTRDTTIGPVGVGSTETIQINVANLAANASNGAAASCTGSVTFNNSTGSPIGTSTSFTLTADQISSVALPFAKIGGTARTEVIGVIAMTTTMTSTSAAPCELRYSLETYDTSTGATHVYVSNAAPGGQAGGAPAGGGPGR
jgi:hypothetical protein